MKIKSKMMAGFGTLMTIIFIVVMVVLSLIVKENIEESLEFQLNSTKESVIVQVNGYIDASVKSYIRGIAEQNREMLRAVSSNKQYLLEILKYSVHKKWDYRDIHMYSIQRVL